MKGRSNRIPVQSAASEDWGDGSWTVDCSCGVTFDDGEEMVNCDLCGVWVHTRCSKYVKNEASFACDKCKGKKRHHVQSEINGNRCFNGGFISVTNKEETEVAQLLAELPTKTDHRSPGFKVWTRSPIEDRVHVHGIPGGDPALFNGLSSIFSKELWKCTGYVAKKFNFKFKEFPCWEAEDENPTNRGADLLFSLSKDVTSRGSGQSYGFGEIQRKVRRDGKIPRTDPVFGGRSLFYAKKERSRIRDGVNPGKRKEYTGVKDRNVKKKARSSVERNIVENKKKGPLSRDDSRKSKIREDDLLEAATLGLENLKSETQKDEMPSEARSCSRYQDDGHYQTPRDEFKTKNRGSDLANEVHVKVETCDQYDSPKTEISPTIGTSIMRSEKLTGPFRENVEESNAVLDGKKINNTSFDNMGDMDETSSSGSLKSEKHTPNNFDLRAKCSSSIAKKKEDLVFEEIHDESVDVVDLSFAPQTETASVCSRLNFKIDESDNVLSSIKVIENDSGERLEQKKTVKEKPKPEVQISSKDAPMVSNLPVKHEERIKPVVNSSASSASSEQKLVLAPLKLTLPSSNQSYLKSPCSTTSSTVEKGIVNEMAKIKASASSVSAEETAKGMAKSHSKIPQPIAKHGDVPRSDSTYSKPALLDSGRRIEKIILPMSHLPSVPLNPPSVNPSSALSDEELARRLHQELNSSPRVPRIPRTRQPDRPHLASGGPTSLLSKNTGGRDQAQVPKRKNKEDPFRDRSRSSHGLGGETRRADRLSCPDMRKEEHFCSSRRGGVLVHDRPSSSSKKTVVQITPLAFKGGDQITSSMGGSSCSTKAPSSDLEASQSLTLPGLIDEIMGKGNCATYEELCDAVLPHWKNLRKPNGEKYAYSNPSQAVLDCLRNRSQWAHLIDRGPKTNCSRKRKASIETDPSRSDSESEDDDDLDDDDDKDEGNSQRDEFPKGRRNVRKHRRLILRRRVLQTRPNSSSEPVCSASYSSGNDDDDDDDGADRGSESFSSGNHEPTPRRPASNSSTSFG